MADALSGRSSYTIEYYIKMDAGFNYHDPASTYTFISKTPLYVASASCGYKLIAPVNRNTGNGHPTGFSLENYANKSGSVTGGSVGDSTDYGDDAWHHIAIVYTETDADAKIGTLDFYVDSIKMGSRTYENVAGTGLKFRLGTGYLKLPGTDDKTATESIHASLACLRVSGAALEKGAFMKVDPTPRVAGMGTAGFWDFKDGAVGASARFVTNRVDASLFLGKAAQNWDGSRVLGDLPTFSDDVPGRIVYSDSTCTNMLARDPQSLRFTPGTGAGGGGKVELDALSTALTRLDGYTIELFFKTESTDNWRSLLGWRFGDKVGIKANLTYGANSTKHRTIAYEVLTNTTGSTMSSIASGTWTTSDSDLGSKWRHIAFTYRKSTGQAEMYVNYQKVVSVAFNPQFLLEQYPLTLGTSAFSGKAIQESYGGFIACPRVSTSILTPSEFMVAQDAEVIPGTVFAWNFEEGVGHDGEKIATITGYPSSNFQSAEMSTVYGLSQIARPCYSESARSRDVTWDGTKMWANGACGWFKGYNYATDLTGTRIYAGTEANLPGETGAFRNPASWTMEAFVKLEFEQDWGGDASGALIFGKFGNATTHKNPKTYPQYCWMLTRLKSGQFKLWWTEQAEDGYAYTADSTDYYRNVTTAASYLSDRKWHHVALRYDKPTRTFSLLVDYSVVLTQVVGGDGRDRDLYDGPYGYYFSRMEPTAGFEGFMDEIRFSSKVRPESELVRFAPTGMLMILR